MTCESYSLHLHDVMNSQLFCFPVYCISPMTAQNIFDNIVRVLSGVGVTGFTRQLKKLVCGRDHAFFFSRQISFSLLFPLFPFFFFFKSCFQGGCACPCLPTQLRHLYFSFLVPPCKEMIGLHYIYKNVDVHVFEKSHEQSSRNGK